MQSFSKDYISPILCSPNDSPVTPGTTVRLTLTNSIPSLPSPILAVVQNPILRVPLIHPTTGCRVSGYRYTFLYDEAQLNGAVTSINECDVLATECVSCCELLQEEVDELQAGLEAETEARISGDVRLEEQLDLEENARQSQDAAILAAFQVADGIPVNYQEPLPNFLETNFPGANNDLRFEQVGATTPTVEFVASGGVGAPPSSVVVTGSAIRINVQFVLGICQITAAQCKTLLEASSAAMELVQVSFKSGNNGSGQLTTDTSIALGPTALSGGQGEVEATPAPPFFRSDGSDLFFFYDGQWYSTPATLV